MSNKIKVPAKINNTPSLNLYHPNAKCTGSAIKFTLHPAHDEVSGYIMLQVAPQKNAAQRDAESGKVLCFPSFDFENAIAVKLCFEDVCKFIEVFRGYHESIEDGKGLFHRTTSRAIAVRLAHMIEPAPGYRLMLAERNSDGGEQREIQFYISPSEALGICGAFEGSLAALAFGNPE